MLYNKNNVRKTNDKKILHKVGKQWKVVSVALLMAIGGGAVATHAANAQSNNTNNNSALEVDEASAEAAPATVSAVSAAPSSATSSSANSAKPSSAVSYVTENGQLTHGAKAASYNNKASNDKAVINDYVQSLNAKLPATAINVANEQIASAKSAENNDNAMANHYSAVAKSDVNSPVVKSLASKAGFTPNDYANYVAWNANNYNNAVNSASAFDNAFSLVSGLANSFAMNNWNNAASVASSNAASVDAKAAIISGTQSATKSGIDYASSVAASNVNANSLALSNAINSSASASVATVITKGLVSSAMSDVDVVAKYLNVNPAEVNSAVNSYAASAKASSSNNNYNASSLSSYSVSNATLSNVSNVSNSVNENSAFSAFEGAISNSASMSNAASATAHDNSVIASADAHSAVYSANSVSASVASSKAAKEISAANDASLVANVANEATGVINKNMTSNSASDATFMQNLANAYHNGGRASLASALGVSPADINTIKGNMDDKLMLASMASAEGVNVLALKNNSSAVKDVLEAGSAAMSGKSMNLSAVQSVANSMSASASTVTSNAQSASASYASANDTDVTLASYYASSYANDASNEANHVSALSASLAAFGATRGVNASAYNSAVADLGNAEAMRDAYAQGAYNNAPKIITILKDGLLHQSVDYGSNNDAKLTGVKAGQKLNVLAIGIANNGALRYRVSVNGKTGFFTSNPGYVKATYLPSNKANGKQSFTMLTSARVFKDANRTQATGKTVKAGDVLKDASVVSVDGSIYGGYTAIETANHEFVTANTNCVEVTPAANNNNNATNNGNNTNNNNQTVYFG